VVVSHISRKTSGIPEFRVRGPIQRARVRFSLRKTAWSFPVPTNLDRKFGGMGTQSFVSGTDQIQGPLFGSFLALFLGFADSRRLLRELFGFFRDPLQ
jgi:hypothetical protein